MVEAGQRTMHDDENEGKYGIVLGPHTEDTSSHSVIASIGPESHLQICSIGI